MCAFISEHTLYCQSLRACISLTFNPKHICKFSLGVQIFQTSLNTKKKKNKTGLKNFKPRENLNHNIHWTTKQQKLQKARICALLLAVGFTKVANYCNLLLKTLPKFICVWHFVVSVLGYHSFLDKNWFWRRYRKL